MTSQEWIKRIMATKKGKHLMDAIVDKDILEEGADDALSALDDKNVWYAKKFIKNREDSIMRIQNMIILGIYPEKEYKAVIHHAPDKDREIYPLYFDPWSILFHAVKIVLEPIAERMMIYDSSAGRTGKGQIFGALRMETFMRKYPQYKFFSQSDLRKFYFSIPHQTIINILRQCIDDKLFIELIIHTVLDFHSNIENILNLEREKKLRYCSWASKEAIPEESLHCERGIIIGSCIGQIITNMVLTPIDHLMKEKYHVKVYHRHCDDIYMGARSIQEAEYQLNRLDYEMNRIGLVIKSTSFAAPLKDEIKNKNGRPIDYIGYVFSRHNMLMRKRNKVHFAKAVARVKSRKRRKEILAAYWGICKWGHCRNLWRTITDNNKMGFADLGIKVAEVTEKDGKRYFHVNSVSISDILNIPIEILDFEDGLKINGKDGRCVVEFIQDGENEKKKFITSSLIIRDQLEKARGLEKKNKKVLFPIKTAIRRKSLGEGKSTYYFE
jgi:hypothetical protein